MSISAVGSAVTTSRTWPLSSWRSRPLMSGVRLAQEASSPWSTRSDCVGWPTLLTSRLEGAHVEAAGAVRRGRGAERRAGEDVDPRSGVEPDEAGPLDQLGRLCFQQSTGNSTGPEVYV